jgi:hypothetical protein
MGVVQRTGGDCESSDECDETGGEDMPDRATQIFGALRILERELMARCPSEVYLN